MEEKAKNDTKLQEAMRKKETGRKKLQRRKKMQSTKTKTVSPKTTPALSVTLIHVPSKAAKCRLKQLLHYQLL